MLIKGLEDIKSNNYRKSDIAIIGMAAKFTKADDAEEFWENIRDGRDCVSDCPEYRKKDVEKYLDFCEISTEDRRYRKAAYINDIDLFDYEFFKISPREAILIDPSHRLFLQTAYSALEDAGYAGKDLDGSKTGIYVGFPTEFSNKVYQNIISETCPSLALDSFSGNLPAILPARLSYYLNLKGPSLLIDTSCSSSLVAIHLACQGIVNGDCELAIAGGINIITVPIVNEVVEAIGIVASDGRTKTFDDNCDGVGQGEGIGAIFLKPLHQALNDGDNIYAVIKGSAINQDGKSIGITAPNAVSQEEVIVKAWGAAGIDPETISYIEAHGTATKLGDPTEILGIKKAFRQYTDKKQFCAIGSVKSNIGHTIGAAGVAGIIKAVMALKYKHIPASIHFNQANKKIKFEDSPVYVNDRLQKWNKDWPRRCGVSSFGVSGTNCHVVLEEAPNTKETPADHIRSPQILTLSAQNFSILKELVYKYRRFLKKCNTPDLFDLCYTANTGRKYFNCRLAMFVTDKLDLIKKIDYLSEADFENVELDNSYCNEIWLSYNSRNIDKKNLNQNTLNMEISLKIKEFISGGFSDKEIINYFCRLYVDGAEIDWNNLYGDVKGHRVSIPTYPFKRTRCWVDISETIPNKQRY